LRQSVLCWCNWSNIVSTKKGSESEIFPWLVTKPEFWVRPTESSVINTKTTKRLPTRRLIISFINTPYVPVVTQAKAMGSKVGRAMMRDFRVCFTCRLFIYKKYICQAVYHSANPRWEKTRNGPSSVYLRVARFHFGFSQTSSSKLRFPNRRFSFQ
jgi:hypothetical protein